MNDNHILKSISTVFGSPWPPQASVSYHPHTGYMVFHCAETTEKVGFLTLATAKNMFFLCFLIFQKMKNIKSPKKTILHVRILPKTGFQLHILKFEFLCFHVFQPCFFIFLVIFFVGFLLFRGCGALVFHNVSFFACAGAPFLKTPTFCYARHNVFSRLVFSGGCGG